MRHFYRTHLTPAAVIAGRRRVLSRARARAVRAARRASRTFGGPLGTLTLSAKPEGGHYTFVEVETDQMGESRLDRNVKRFFVTLHRQADPGA